MQVGLHDVFSLRLMELSESQRVSVWPLHLRSKNKSFNRIYKYHQVITTIKC